MSGSSTCRSCGRPIVWAKTSGGKNMPIDPEPKPDGNMLLDPVGTENGKVLFRTRVIKASDISAFAREEQQPKRYFSHFKTCPHAAEHRR